MSRFPTLPLSKDAACDPNAVPSQPTLPLFGSTKLLVAFSCQHYFARSVSSVLSNNRISEASTHEDQSDTPTMSLILQRNGYERWLFIHSPIHLCLRIVPPRSTCTVWARRSWQSRLSPWVFDNSHPSLYVFFKSRVFHILFLESHHLTPPPMVVIKHLILNDGI